jgi:hypothetical protein
MRNGARGTNRTEAGFAKQVAEDATQFRPAIVDGPTADN